MVSDEVTLLVSSCDKYRTAWLPFFELVKQNWKEHPERIVLNTETLQYMHEGLNIKTINSPQGSTWSQRILHCLGEIESEFVIFSLEDFFLQKRVNAEILEECLDKMKQNKQIACFRLKASNDAHLVKDDNSLFRLAGADVPYRLDTQFAMWRKNILISFIEENESPWEFEGKGTQRVRGTDKLFYWYYADNPEVISDQLIVPYVIGHFTGYGIQWGKWLYNNEKLFKQYGISANFDELGVLSEKEVNLRMKTVYNNNAVGKDKVIKIFWSFILKFQHCLEIINKEGLRMFIIKARERGRK